MPLFWIVRDINGKPHVYIQEGLDKINARMRAALAGFKIEGFREIHQLDEKTAKRIPRGMIGREISPREAAELLKMMG